MENSALVTYIVNHNLVNSNEGIQRKLKSWIGKFRLNHESNVQFQYQTRVPKARVAGIGIAPCFRDLGGIFQSMILIFVGFPQFKCDICNAKFGQKCSLDRHVVIAHEEKKQLKCEM